MSCGRSKDPLVEKSGNDESAARAASTTRAASHATSATGSKLGSKMGGSHAGGNSSAAGSFVSGAALSKLSKAGGSYEPRIYIVRGILNFKSSVGRQTVNQTCGCDDALSDSSVAVSSVGSFAEGSSLRGGGSSSSAVNQTGGRGRWRGRVQGGPGRKLVFNGVSGAASNVGASAAGSKGCACRGSSGASSKADSKSSIAK